VTPGGQLGPRRGHWRNLNLNRDARANLNTCTFKRATQAQSQSQWPSQVTMQWAGNPPLTTGNLNSSLRQAWGRADSEVRVPDPPWPATVSQPPGYCVHSRSPWARNDAAPAARPVPIQGRRGDANHIQPGPPQARGRGAAGPGAPAKSGPGRADAAIVHAPPDDAPAARPDTQQSAPARPAAGRARRRRVRAHAHIPISPPP
jgi:hypothetical protein